MRQAQVKLRFGLLPALRLYAPLNAQRQGLAVRQNAAGIEPKPLVVDAQAQIGIAQGQRRFAEGLEGDLTVQNGEPSHLLQRLDKLLRVGRRLLGSLRQPLHSPFAIGIFGHGEMHAGQFQRCEAQPAYPKAGSQIRDDSDTVQAHGTVALTKQHIMCKQLGGEALPATFQPAQGHRHVQRRLRLFLHLVSILGHQGHQLPAEADVQRGQNEPERCQPEQLARQDHEKSGEAAHTGALRSSWPGRPDLPLFRATPRRTVPASTCFPPGT